MAPITTSQPTTTQPTPQPTTLPTPLPTTPVPTTSQPTTSPPTLSPTAGTDITTTILGSYELIETIPHDSTAFTQGLEVLSYERFFNSTGNTSSTTPNNSNNNNNNNKYYMIESTGQYGQSSIRIVDYLSTTGQVIVIDQINLDDTYFGEGCTAYYDPQNPNEIQIYQITWLSGTGFIYTIPFDTVFGNSEGNNVPPTLTQVGTFDINTTTGEGWGIIYHPILQQFIVSDGSNNLHFWKLNDEGNGGRTFQTVRTVSVTRHSPTSDNSWISLSNLNELEYDPSYPNTVLANVWYEDNIVRIDLDTGKVTHQYDMSSLEKPNTNSGSVLNGIAAIWDESTVGDQQQFWVTGKYWPSMYRIRFVS